MIRRTTIELDEDLLARARLALGTPTTRATVEAALRHVADTGEAGQKALRDRQATLLDRLPEMLDTDVLASGEMWR